MTPAARLLASIGSGHAVLKLQAVSLQQREYRTAVYLATRASELERNFDILACEVNCVRAHLALDETFGASQAYFRAEHAYLMWERAVWPSELMPSEKGEASLALQKLIWAGRQLSKVLDLADTLRLELPKRIAHYEHKQRALLQSRN